MGSAPRSQTNQTLLGLWPMYSPVCLGLALAVHKACANSRATRAPSFEREGSELEELNPSLVPWQMPPDQPGLSSGSFPVRLKNRASIPRGKCGFASLVSCPTIPYPSYTNDVDSRIQEDRARCSLNGY